MPLASDGSFAVMSQTVDPDTEVDWFVNAGNLPSTTEKTFSVLCGDLLDTITKLGFFISICSCKTPLEPDQAHYTHKLRRDPVYVNVSQIGWETKSDWTC